MQNVQFCWNLSGVKDFNLISISTPDKTQMTLGFIQPIRNFYTSVQPSKNIKLTLMEQINLCLFI